MIRSFGLLPWLQAAHIVSDQSEVLYADFKKMHPEVTLELSQYKEELPWNRKKAYRETCLDRIDLNFQWHHDALKVALDMLSPLHSASSADAEGDAAVEAPQPDPLLRELAALAALKSKTAIANFLVCSEGAIRALERLPMMLHGGDHLSLVASPRIDTPVFRTCHP